LDTDKDGNCNNENYKNTTDENGSYTLIVSGNINKETPLIVQGGIDTTTGGEINATFKAPYDGSKSINITPLTTLAYNIIKEENININQAYKKVAKVLLGSNDPNIVKIDYIKEKNTTIGKKVLKIHQTAKLLDEVTNEEIDEIYKHLSEGILKVAQENKNDVNITTIVEEIKSDISSNIKIEKIVKTIEALESIIDENDTIDDEVVIKIDYLIENNITQIIIDKINENNNTDDIKNLIEENMESIEPEKIKIENILKNEFNITNSNITTNIETIISNLNITSASDISKEKLCELKDINNTIYQQLQLDKECEDSNNIENIQENLILPPTVPIINNNGEINSSQGELALPPTVPQI